MQQEIDSVIESKRLITVADRQNLPYTNAVIMVRAILYVNSQKLGSSTLWKYHISKLLSLRIKGHRDRGSSN
jgi:hypothetical protein